jgi:hypothetical protein
MRVFSARCLPKGVRTYLEEAVHLGPLEVVEEGVAEDEEARGTAIEERAPPPPVVFTRKLQGDGAEKKAVSQVVVGSRAEADVGVPGSR